MSKARELVEEIDQLLESFNVYRRRSQPTIDDFHTLESLLEKVRYLSLACGLSEPAPLAEASLRIYNPGSHDILVPWDPGWNQKAGKTFEEKIRSLQDQARALGTAAPPAQGTDESATTGLKPSREKAYRLFLWAMEQNANLKTDQDVYQWLNERPELPDELPNFASWSKYLREARAYYQDHKHTPRIAKPSGKNVVRRDQI